MGNPFAEASMKGAPEGIKKLSRRLVSEIQGATHKVSGDFQGITQKFSEDFRNGAKQVEEVIQKAGNGAKKAAANFIAGGSVKCLNESTVNVATPYVTTEHHFSAVEEPSNQFHDFDLSLYSSFGDGDVYPTNLENQLECDDQGIDGLDLEGSLDVRDREFEDAYQPTLELQGQRFPRGIINDAWPSYMHADDLYSDTISSSSPQTIWDESIDQGIYQEYQDSIVSVENIGSPALYQDSTGNGQAFLGELSEPSSAAEFTQELLPHTQIREQETIGSPIVPLTSPSPVPNVNESFWAQADPSGLGPRQTQVEDGYLRFDDDFFLNRRFVIAADRMLKKLQHESRRKSASPQFRDFVDFQLKDLANIIRIGLGVLKSVLDGSIPKDIAEVYCFLHVAYAMSRADKDAKDEHLSQSEFQEELKVFRNCLQSVPEELDKPSEQDLFDEVVKVMWTEFQQAIKWSKSVLSPNLNQQLQDVIKMDQKRPRTPKGQVVKKGPRNGVQKTSPGSSSKPSLNMITKRFQKMEISNITMTAKPPRARKTSLLVTVDLIISSKVFQDVLIAVEKFGLERFFYLFLNTVSPNMLQWMNKDRTVFPTIYDEVGCVFCGDPNAFEAGLTCPTCDDTIQHLPQTDAITITVLYEQVAEELKNSRSEGKTPYGVTRLICARVNPKSPPKPVRPRSQGEGKHVCPIVGCGHGPWVKKQSLDRHIQAVHTPRSQAYLICGFNGCNVKRGLRGFTEEDRDNMLTHKRQTGHFTAGERGGDKVGIEVSIYE
ncbi:hypothetical protein TWF481_008319 [Arthrobotrys musiformis]|uniref:C2H2-type domain-containing protein n=1 Tax=Arthrobotrys musiformis TaxID=47236 RepID=A0AAV9W6R5_9PEZI